MSRKDYRVTVKVRNNNILSAAEAAGYTSMPTLAEAIGWNYVGLNSLINMTLSPFDRYGKVRRQVDDLCLLLATPFDDLFSVQQCEALATNKKTVEVDAEQMFALIHQPPVVSEITYDDGRAEAITQALEWLSPKERKVLEKRMGFGGEQEMTLVAIGEEMGLSIERVRQIEAKALRKLRHPLLSEGLRVFLHEDDHLPIPYKTGTLAKEYAPPDEVLEWAEKLGRDPTMLEVRRKFRCDRGTAYSVLFNLRALRLADQARSA